MIKRLIFSVYTFYKYRSQLTAIKNNSKQQIERVTEIDEVTNIKCLVLDFDGVLASHGTLDIPPDIFAWLQACSAKFSKGYIYVLTNNCSKTRVDYFAKYFPQIQLIAGVRKKPYPDGLQKIMTLTECKPEEVLLVDDRLATGCLAAYIAKVNILYVNKPLINLKGKFIAEVFFIVLRFCERLLLFKK